MGVTQPWSDTAAHCRAKPSRALQAAPTIHEFINCDSWELRANRARSHELCDMVIGRLHARLGHDDASAGVRRPYCVRNRSTGLFLVLASPARGSADSLR